MQAIILAAGMGRRLGKLTEDKTKCMLDVNGTTLIERSLTILSEAKIAKAILVIGYEGDKVKELIGESYKGIKIEYILNSVFDQTNNIYSLYLAREALMQDDTLLLESDLIYDEKIIRDLLESKISNLAVVDRYQSWMDGTVVQLTGENDILRLIPKAHFKSEDIPSYYKTVNIYKFSKEFSKTDYVPFLSAYCESLGHNEYYEQVLRILVLLEKKNIKAHILDGERWYEIDDIQDLDNAETIFSRQEETHLLMQRRYGGYWRFPALRDFCYLVNPYFPDQKMIEEIKYSFETLLREYPSALRVQNLLASKMFNCPQSMILVGNGAAELMVHMAPEFEGKKVGVIYPTFEEYPARFKQSTIVPFETSVLNFKYSVDDLLKFSEKIDALILVNPDNPSGNYLSHADVLKLAGSLGAAGKALVLDESFVDFSTEGSEATFLTESLLTSHPQLMVVKSISKSYGVPGARLGILASANIDMMARIRTRIPVWNINSFGEFFLQIVGKYEKTYAKACDLVRTERARFFDLLKRNLVMDVYPSQANFFLCKLKPGYDADELSGKLMNGSFVLVKNCTGKTGFGHGQFIRIAVRDKDDNDFFAAKLEELHQ